MRKKLADEQVQIVNTKAINLHASANFLHPILYNSRRAASTGKKATKPWCLPGNAMELHTLSFTNLSGIKVFLGSQLGGNPVTAYTSFQIPTT